MSNALVLHRGGRLVGVDELRSAPVPEGTRTWHPIGHGVVLDSVRQTLTGAGFAVRSENLALARDGMRFFGVLDLTAPLADGVSLSVGVRNSVDRSFPLGFAAGSRVFVCDNLAFRAELMVRRKHTINGMKSFGNAIAGAVAGLAAFQAIEGARIRQMQEMVLGDAVASHLILRAFRVGIISSLQIAGVCKEWERPSHADFEPRTAWSLMNAFTEVLKPRAVKMPNEFVAATIRLNGLILPEVQAPAIAA